VRQAPVRAGQNLVERGQEAGFVEVARFELSGDQGIVRFERERGQGGGQAGAGG
jgi:hypothetical protein